MTTPTPTQELIEQECYFIRDLLLDKNRKYGDSAVNPCRIFSRADAIEQINVRIDDKLSRIASAQDDDNEDAELDLIGYLILKRVAQRAGRIIDHLANREQQQARQDAASIAVQFATGAEKFEPVDEPVEVPAIYGQQIDQKLPATPKIDELSIPTMGDLCRSRRDQAVLGVNA